ncbi:MAG: hypothetical protein ACT6RA_19020, partial [Flavobacterium sp.]
MTEVFTCNSEADTFIIRKAAEFIARKAAKVGGALGDACLHPVHLAAYTSTLIIIIIIITTTNPSAASPAPASGGICWRTA